MGRYRKKPIVVEAVQFWEAQSPVPESVVFRREGGGLGFRWQILTLEGWLTVSDGDWIITGVQGEKYPCKPDIFEQTYEEVR